MNEGEPPTDDPQRPDANAFTQPLVVPSIAPDVVATPIAERAYVAPDARVAKSEKAAYTPTFGNLGTYACARSIALVIDFGVVPFALACFAFNLADRGTLLFAPRTSAGFGTIATLALGTALLFAILFESIFETTLGKALFGLGVRRGTGQHAGLQRIVVRYLLLPLDLLVVGELLALVTRRHQRIGDFAAGTVVARHRIGGFVTALALVLFAGLIYAQATAGGGITSALAVTAEGAYFGPALAQGALAALGLGTRPDAPLAMPTANAANATAVPAGDLTPSPAQTT